MIELPVLIKYRKDTYQGNCAKVKSGIILYEYDTNSMFVNIPLCDEEWDFVKETLIQFLQSELENMTVFNSKILKKENIVIQVSL